MKKILLLFAFILLTAIGSSQVFVGDKIAPLGEYGTHIDTNGIGGYWSCTDTIQRNSIITGKRRQGMAAYCIDVNKLYILVGGISNTNWAEFAGGSSSSNYVYAYPSRKNLVIGNGIPASMDTTTYATNITTIGFHAGESITEGDAVTFVGAFAGQKMKGDINGYFNTFVGACAGQNGVECFDNVAIGDSALNKIQDAAGNCALGSRALADNTTGYYNLACGSFCGRGNTTGDYNIYIGTAAGLSNTTQNGRLYIDSYGLFNAGKADDTTQAIIFGVQFEKPDNSLQRLWLNAKTTSRFLFNAPQIGNLTDTILVIDANNNLKLGANAGFFKPSGTQNNFIGNSAGYKCTTGSYNTYLGYYAGYNIRTGNYRILLDNRNRGSDNADTTLAPVHIVTSTTTANQRIELNGVVKLTDPLKPKIYSQATEPDIPNDSMAFWKDTDDNKFYIILDIGGTQKKTELT